MTSGPHVSGRRAATRAWPSDATRIPVRRLRDLEAARRQPDKEEVAAVAAACNLPLAMLTSEWQALGSPAPALANIAARMSPLEDRLARVEALLSLPGQARAPRRP